MYWKTTLIYLLSICSVYGQQKVTSYFVTIGKHNCSPGFYENPYNSGGMLSAIEEGEVISNPPLYFPKRVDTVVHESPDKKITKKIEVTDHYEFECGEDTITYNEIDSLIKGQIMVTRNNKQLKLQRYVLNVVYRDGKTRSLESATNRISDNDKALAIFENKKEIIYMGIGNIEFVNEKGLKLTIPEGYCFRIINNP